MIIYYLFLWHRLNLPSLHTSDTTTNISKIHATDATQFTQYFSVIVFAEDAHIEMRQSQLGINIDIFEMVFVWIKSTSRLGLNILRLQLGDDKFSQYLQNEWPEYWIWYLHYCQNHTDP